MIQEFRNRQNHILNSTSFPVYSTDLNILVQEINNLSKKIDSALNNTTELESLKTLVVSLQEEVSQLILKVENTKINKTNKQKN